MTFIHDRSTQRERMASMAFTDEEIAYLRSQPLARIASVGAEGQPDVVPAGFNFDGTHILIGGFNAAATRRHDNVAAGYTKVALVVDDLVSAEPWTTRFLRIYGIAEVTASGDLRITPTISWSWNLDGQPLDQATMSQPPRRTVHRR